MDKKSFVLLLVLIALLAVSILLMSISLLLSERAFGQISSYIAIACVTVTLVGVVVVLHTNNKSHNKSDEDKK